MDQFLSAIPIKIRCRINVKGQVETVSVNPSRPNRFVQDTSVRVLKSIKFPPIPKEVVAELGKN